MATTDLTMDMDREMTNVEINRVVDLNLEIRREMDTEMIGTGLANKLEIVPQAQEMTGEISLVSDQVPTQVTTDFLDQVAVA